MCSLPCQQKTERHIFHASVTRNPNAILTPASKRRFYVRHGPHFAFCGALMFHHGAFSPKQSCKLLRTASPQQRGLNQPARSLPLALSMRLPENLPPSFRGTAARFSYRMMANAKEVAPRGVAETSPSHPSPFAASMENGSLANGVELPLHTVKVQFIVWPPNKAGGPRGRSSFDGNTCKLLCPCYHHPSLICFPPPCVVGGNATVEHQIQTTAHAHQDSLGLFGVSHVSPQAEVGAGGKNPSSGPPEPVAGAVARDSSSSRPRAAAGLPRDWAMHLASGGLCRPAPLASAPTPEILSHLQTLSSRRTSSGKQRSRSSTTALEQGPTTSASS